MKVPQSYYPVRYALGGVERFLLWYSDEPDGVLLSSPTRLAFFADLAEVLRYASERSLKLESKAPTFYDFDRLADWLSQPRSDPDCQFLLEAWNMLGDIAASLSVSLAEPLEANGVYDKLFWGCNPPIMAPPGQHIEPVWSQLEIAALSRVLFSGLHVLREAEKHAA